MSEDNNNILLVTKSRDDAQALATAVRENFRNLRPWPCVIASGQEFRVTVDGPWGSRLPKDEEAKIKTFAKKFAKAPTSEKN
jgi:hypothetical protein